MHCELAFANFVIRESLRMQTPSITVGSLTAEETDLQLVCQTKLLHSPDEPFGRVVLVPLDSISVVHRKLVVEIVITLSDSDKCGNHMVAGCVLVVERSLTEPVGEGIDTEGRLTTNQSAR